MELIKQLIINSNQISEDAAGGSTGAGNVASFSMPMFGSFIKRQIPNASSIQVIKYSDSPKKKSKLKSKLKLKESFNSLYEELASSNVSDFDSSEVISKLKSLENRESVDHRDITTFGLIDSKEQIVRVSVPLDQAESFEQEIQAFLSDRDESKPAPEIAELLFKMKDHYTIINVEWPKIEEDEEENQQVQGSDKNATADGENSDQLDLPTGGADMPPPQQQDDTQATSMLQSVIDLLKSDIETRKAEAQAREAEAKTRQADAAKDHAMAKIRDQEQQLDFDEYSKNQKAQEKEAKRLAQLAKWKHDIGSGKIEQRPAQEPMYTGTPSEEDEEMFKSHSVQNKAPKGKVSSTDIAKYIMSRSGK